MSIRKIKPLSNKLLLIEGTVTMRKKIIEESIDLFDKKGFNKTSIQNIVDSIGVTKGTFYYYFNSKQELLRDIHLSYIQELLYEQEIVINEKNSNSRKG